MNTSTVILKFGNEKHCFLLLIDNSGLRVNRSSNTASSGIIVYETDLPSGQKAYFTVLGNSVELNSGDIVELNKEYGIRLGFKDDFESPLPLKAIGHVSSAKRVFVEPLTANDWEIIKSQSIKVESLILNQVRVVWPGQLLPLWLMKNVSISLKINSVEPPTPCALLEQNTEIVINPKNRIISPPSSLGLQRQQSGPNLNTRHWVSLDKGLDTLEPKPLQSPVKNVSTNRRDHHRQRNISNPEHNLVSRQTSVINWMRSLFQAPVVSKKNSPDAGSGIDFSMGKQPSRSGVLRVQPMKIKYTLDQSFPIDKSAINRQITSRGGFKIEEKVDPNFASENHFNVPYEIFQPSTVYVDAESAKYERQLHPYLPYLPNNFIARLKKLPAPNEKTAKSIKNVPPTTNGGQGDTSEINNSSVDSSNFSDCCYVRVVAIDRKAGLTDHVWRNAADEVLSQQPLLFGHVIIPDMLRCQLNLKATSSVWLKTGPFEPIIPKKVCIYPVKSTIPAGSNTDSLKASFIHYINQCADENHPLVVFQGLFLKFMTFKGHPVEAQLTFFGDNPASVKDVTMLSVANIDSVLLTVELDEKVDKLGVISPMSTASKITSLDPKPLINKLEFLGGVDNIIEQAITYLHASLGVRPLSQHSFLPHVGLCHGILLITGPSGCGKSSLVKAISAKMSELPVLAYVNYVNCKNLRGSALSLIKKNLEIMFDEAAWYGPSVIIFDNLDTIVPAPAGPEAEMSLEMMYSTKVAQILQKMIKLEIENCSRVMVLATSKSRSSLHPSLVSTQGIHYVQKTLHIGSPNKTTREEILQAIIRGHLGLSDMTSSTLDLSLLASKTEGYVARDLESLVKMAIHYKLGKYGDVPKDHLSLSFDDFEDALNTFKPVSVRHIQLHKPGQLGWADVGGLNHVKTDLIETLKWPSKYPELFNSCPLRMRSGILLYGAPGTGKTLLAGVVAKECGLNFISIKGPELLNKYTGASEQAVRELFTRAQNVKPCILFFDEFDSIAPKRGHDNTGVTDRVVNQLLTQLDGVEGLQGVYVLAATSRPDLIDPALLRPGRLDKSILCEMPDKEERTEILNALSRKMSLACDVDFDEIAAICEHFTGADLKALLYNAQLKAIHEYTDDHSMKDVVRLRGNSHLCDSICRDDSKPKLVFPDSRSGSFSGDSPSYNYTPSTPKGKKNDSPRSRSGTHFNFNDVDKFVDNADEKSLKDVVKLRGNSFISDSMSQNDSEDEKDISETCITVSRSRICSGDSLSHNGSNSTPKSKTNDSPKSNSVEQLSLNDNVSDDMNITVKYNAHESSTVTKDLTVKQVEVTSSTSDEKTNSETDKPSGDNQDSVVKFYLQRGVKEKRKRHYARENKFIAAADKPSEDSQCLPLENPVTVFTSLERGLATLSPENKARYLAMVKEIQRRDEFLFQAANDKRRTSLQLASRPSALLEVNQRHLRESAKSMRPSVSPTEREKYSSIYQSFMSSKTKRFEKTQEHQVGLRSTLA